MEGEPPCIMLLTILKPLPGTQELHLELIIVNGNSGADRSIAHVKLATLAGLRTLEPGLQLELIRFGLE